MSRERFVNPWSSEEEIAALTRQALESLGWIVHPETGGFDLLAVAGETVNHFAMGDGRAQPGDVLGVECKLDAGTLAGFTSLLRQSAAFPDGARWGGTASADYYAPRLGVHFRAAVAPRFAEREVFRRLGVYVVVCRTRDYSQVTWRGEAPEVRRSTVGEIAKDFLHVSPRFRPARTPDIPEIVIDVPAGVPSPQTSSKWKVAAVRIMLRLAAGELLTSAEIEAAGVAFSTFRTQAWVADSGQRRGRSYLWTVGPSQEAPHLRYPEIVTALRAKDAAVEGAA